MVESEGVLLVHSGVPRKWVVGRVVVHSEGVLITDSGEC